MSEVGIDLKDQLPETPQPFERLGGYEAALQAAGVVVEGFENFGSYKGAWWAKVKAPDGKSYFVEGSFGSCSYCDAFEAEFGWDAEEQPDYAERMRRFGLEYLDNALTKEQALAKASKDIEWDLDAKDMVEWIASQ